jgi:uncharacterized protein
MKRRLLIAVVPLIIYLGYLSRPISQPPTSVVMENEGGPVVPALPLAITYMRGQSYPGSVIEIKATLTNGTNYSRYLASYLSEGLTINGLLTIPMGEAPPGGWPAIVFNHGYIPPKEYRTTEKYVAYVDGFARNGYVVFKIDYRGHGESEGEAAGGYGSPSYTIDALNAFTSLQQYPGINSNAVGMWGHSMGGQVTLRSMVVNPNIKAGVIWAGVVAPYSDLLNKWRRGNTTAVPTQFNRPNSWRQEFINHYGTPESNPAFWESISPNSYLSQISGPIELHHATTDETVPVEFSQTLTQQIKAAGKTVNLYLYENDDHNLSQHFSQAMSRSLAFFAQNLKSD